ncbi:MAG: ABC transporter permease subunit, partial [Nitrospira sp.]|nr:ABC transporter permease subunit [Nitrospira sp.]
SFKDEGWQLDKNRSVRIMHKILKGMNGDRVFRGATVSALAVLTIFFSGIIISLLTYTNWSSILVAACSREILFAAGLSLITATVSTFIAIVVAVPVAYAISKNNFFGKSFIDSLLDLPIVISPIAIGAALLVFFSTPIGSAVNNHFINFVFAVPGIVLAQFTIVSALAIRLLKSTFDSIDLRYEQVGRTLGCSKPEAFFRIIVPLARNGLIASSILTWARAVGEFGASVTLAGAMAMKTETLPIAISLNLANANIEMTIAIILLLIIIAIIALFAIRKITGKRWAL